MSRFGLGLEDQEQELEIDTAIDVESERAALAGDSMADSPFSPMVSRVFSTAVDDTDTLERMNDVLEGSDIEGIPESSRRVIQTAMESVRSRLLGGYSVGGVAVEGFANNKDLKIAIEDNKNILQRAWDAIVKFFKGIYDWFAGFFKKKEESVKNAEAEISKKEKAIKALENLNVDNLTQSETIEEVNKIAKLHGVKVKLPNGVILNESGEKKAASEDGTDLMEYLKRILLGQAAITLVSNQFNPIFGEEDVSFVSSKLSDTDYSAKQMKAIRKGMSETGLENAAQKPLTKENLASVTEKTLQQIFGDTFELSKGSSLVFNGNSVSIKRAESKEISISITGRPSESKAALGVIKVFLKEAKEMGQELNEFTAKMIKKVFDFDKKLSADSTESEETVKMLKQKMQLINGCMKFIVLTQNESYKVVKLTIDFIDSYIASVALIASHAKRAV